MRYYDLYLNPIQWAIGPLSLKRIKPKPGRPPYVPIVGQNVELRSFQDALKQEFGRKYGDAPMLEGDLFLKFWFWHDRPQFIAKDGSHRQKRQVDATNLQKAAEDGLQGVLFKNDVQVRRVTSEWVEQGKDVVGRVVIGVGHYEPEMLPTFLDERRADQPQLEFEPAPLAVTWQAPEEGAF
jgi:hypothetical protein